MNWKVRSDQNGSTLTHYGVKGMKWGVRKEYVPHPRKKGSIQNVGAKRLKYKSLAAAKAREIAKETTLRTIAMLDPTGISAMAYNARVFAKAAGGKEAFQSNEKYMAKDGPVENLKQIRKKSMTGQSMEDDSKFVNPGSRQGRTNNCMCCVTALEMRQRGYDVQARRRIFGYTTSTYNDWFSGLKIESVKTTREMKESRRRFVERGYENLTKHLEKYPNGSRGFIAFAYEGTNSGHTLSWQVKDGEVSFYDAQGRSTAADKVLSFSSQNYEYGRLDTCSLKPAIAESVVSRKGKR